MDWLDRMNSAMDYIDANLADEISYDRIARLACCSVYHFQRMFPFITGVTLSEYIRRRRLTQAAYELQTSPIKVIDAAMKYGYDSPEAFSRAFKKQHGVLPASARKKGVSLKAYPPMTFSISMKGAAEMQYRIEEREGFEMFGVYREISTDREEAFREVPVFCKWCDDQGLTDEMNRRLGRFHDHYLISALYDYTETSFKYMIGYYLPEDFKHSPEFTRLSVPAQTWAIFSEPACDMQTLWKRIWTEWLPTAGYETVEGPQFEMFYGMAGHGLGEIWVPVRKVK